MLFRDTVKFPKNPLKELNVIACRWKDAGERWSWGDTICKKSCRAVWVLIIDRSKQFWFRYELKAKQKREGRERKEWRWGGGKARGRGKKMKRWQFTLSLLWPGHLLLVPGTNLPKHEPLSGNTARSKVIWETRHKLGTHLGMGSQDCW